MMKEEQINILIQKNLAGKCSEQEQEILQAWLREKAENQSHYDQISDIDQNLEHIDLSLNPDTEKQWNHLNNKISNRRQTAKVVSVKSGFRRFIQIAASVVLLAGLGWYSYSELGLGEEKIAHHFSTPMKQTSKITLEDGTIVQLNADSKMQVVKGFNKKHRKVYLEGEAFFEVAKNKKIPFEIHVGDVQTQVLGTEFNLKAYPESDKVELAVIEGKVAFIHAQDTLLREISQGAIFNKSTKTIEEYKFHQTATLSWRYGMLMFYNADLDEAFKALERRFNITVDNQSTRKKITLNVERGEKLKEVLNAIEQVNFVAWEINGTTVTFKDK